MTSRLRLRAGVSTPTITTVLPSATGNTSATVRDSATPTRAIANAGGTVTYTVYTDSKCKTSVTDGGTVNATNRSVVIRPPCTDEQLVIAPLIGLTVTKVGSPNPV